MGFLRFPSYYPLVLSIHYSLVLTIRLFIVRLTLESVMTFPPITLMISSPSSLFVLQMGLSLPV